MTTTTIHPAHDTDVSTAECPASPTWDPQPAGANWILNQVARFRELNADVREFEILLREQTGTRLGDWIDHLFVRSGDGLEQAGFRQQDNGWYEHPGALLPPVRVSDRDEMRLRVDSVSDFAVANSHRFRFSMSGEPLDLWRVVTFENNSPARLSVVERHGCYCGAPAKSQSDGEKREWASTRERLRHRRREFPDEHTAFDDTTRLVAEAIHAVGRDVACDLFFEGERCYWQARNRAARVQFMRQSAIGIGWGNHDHHTYRSSRSCFHRLIGLFELMGFRCRERFHAGAHAGWGAQVLEHPVCGVVIFADVDLTPTEITGDIAHHPLPPLNELGTIGLWCALHGEALFEAGMHHLECQFDFDGARTQLEQFGIASMKPFTDFPFLRQCFTEGERWSVRLSRIDRALASGWITAEQANQFRVNGAVGSHLEILERNDGYRGFNQTGINEIIRQTDPRLLKVSSP